MMLMNNYENLDVQLLYEDFPYMTYVRVSTDKDEQVSSPENQIDICRYWLEKNNFEWNEKSVVFDNGISGSVLLERPAMQLILAKARRRELKMVIFKSIHRLARDMRDSLEIKETLIAHGVRLVTIEEGYDSLYEGKNDMKFEMFSMFAAQYPKSLSVSITGALAAKVRRGEHLGQIPYGYKSIDKKLAINEEVAPTIRKMYEWHTRDGMGYKAITRKLNEELEKGNVVPPKRKTKWQITTVQTILKNPSYCGTFIHNKYTNVKIDGRKKQIQNPREKWNIYEDYHPAIVSKAKWEKANNKKHKNNKKRITPWNEFRGILVCSECGSNMVISQSYKTRKKDKVRVEWKYFKCSAYRRAGYEECVNHAPILYEDFRALMLKKLKRKSKNVAINFENTIIKQKQREIESLEQKLVQLKEMNAGLVDLLLKDKLISKQEFQVKRQEYEADIERIQDQVFLLKQEDHSHASIKNIKDAFDQLEKHDKDLHHAWAELIKKIVMYPDGKVDIHYTFIK